MSEVDMIINQTLERRIEQISAFKVDTRNDIHQLRKMMNERFSSLETRLESIEQRLVAAETRLEMVQETKQDYAFKAGWLILIVAIFYALIHGNIIVGG